MYKNQGFLDPEQEKRKSQQLCQDDSVTLKKSRNSRFWKKRGQICKTASFYVPISFSIKAKWPSG